MSEMKCAECGEVTPANALFEDYVCQECGFRLCATCYEYPDNPKKWDEDLTLCPCCVEEIKRKVHDE